MAAPVIRQFINAHATSLTFGVNLASNSYIVFYVNGNGGATLNSVVSSAGNTYTLIPLSGSSAGSGYMYSGPNTAGVVSETITFNFVGGVAGFGVALESTGVFLSRPLDSVGPIGFFGASPVTAPSVSVLTSDTLVLVLGFTNNGTAITWQAPYAGFVTQVNSSNSILGSGTESSPGTYAPVFTKTAPSDLLGTVVLASKGLGSTGSQTWLCTNMNQSLRGLRK